MATPQSVSKNRNDEIEEESPVPKAVSYSTLEERVAALEDDNAALRSMLGRQRTPENPRSASPGLVPTSARRNADELNQKRQEVRTEIEKRRGVEATLAKEKDAFQSAMYKKDQEIRKLQTELQKSRMENDANRIRADEADALVIILKKENFRLAGILKDHKIEDKIEAPDHFTSNNNARAERIKKDVPSSRPFSAALRSISPLLKGGDNSSAGNRSHTPTRKALGQEAPVKRPNGQSSSVASNDGSRQAAGTRFGGGAATRRSASPNSANGDAAAKPAAKTSRYSLVPPKRDTGVRGATVSANDRKRGVDYKIGARVTWQGNPGVVRYKGPVVSIGEGSWVGLELAVDGSGEHNGTLNGVRYFTTAAKSAVFVRMNELVAPKDVHVSPSSRSPSVDKQRSASPNK